MADPAGGATRRFVANALIAIGWLMVGLCGTCTVVFLTESVVALTQHQPAGEFGPNFIPIMALILGGPPIVIGALLIWTGRSLLGPKPPPSAPPPG
jgi:hypothetical protein